MNALLPMSFSNSLNVSEGCDVWCIAICDVFMMREFMFLSFILQVGVIPNYRERNFRVCRVFLGDKRLCCVYIHPAIHNVFYALAGTFDRLGLGRETKRFRLSVARWPTVEGKTPPLSLISWLVHNVVDTTKRCMYLLSKAPLVKRLKVEIMRNAKKS